MKAYALIKDLDFYEKSLNDNECVVAFSFYIGKSMKSNHERVIVSVDGKDTKESIDPVFETAITQRIQELTGQTIDILVLL